MPTHNQTSRRTAEELPPLTEASPAERGPAQSRGSGVTNFTVDPKYCGTGGDNERRLINKLYQSSRDVEAEREAKRNLDHSLRMAELMKLKMSERDEYCSELERKNLRSAL